jgi:hypothetical protein
VSTDFLLEIVLFRSFTAIYFGMTVIVEVVLFGMYLTIYCSIFFHYSDIRDVMINFYA